ncbi:hypothetical protein L7F22_019939 [Adiantum nelumboides]|nr:hypothetical protein [Adiantum nelumboides]
MTTKKIGQKSAQLVILLVIAISSVLIVLWPWLFNVQQEKRQLASHILPLFDSHLRDIALYPWSWQKYENEFNSKQPQTRTYDWTISRSLLAPDGVLREMITVNGAFPGPTIEANIGDGIVVNVQNDLPIPEKQPERQRYSTMMHKVHHKYADSHVALHWHGLRMYAQPEQDGAHGFTSCSIPPGKSHTYNFTLGPQDVGTHWWHSHVGMSRSDGLWGALIVRDPKERQQIATIAGQSYEAEALVTFGDHYHKTGAHQLSWFMSLSSLGFEPTPESSLINGRNIFNCSRAVAPDTACSSLHSQYSRIQLGTTKERTRLRLINVGAVANQFVSIDHHTLTIIEVDGTLIKPFTVRRLTIAPGQRYSVIVDKVENAPKSVEEFWLRTTIDHECFNMPNPALTLTSKAIIQYSNTPKVPHQDTSFGSSGLDLRSRGISSDEISQVWQKLSIFGSKDKPKTQAWPEASEPENGILMDSCQDVHHSALKPLFGEQDPAPAVVDQRFILDAKMPRLSTNKLVPMGYINGSSWRSNENEPLLNQYLVRKGDNNAVKAGKGNSPMILELPSLSTKSQFIEVIVQNWDDGPHPFHLHGHKFWVMETFQTAYLHGLYKDEGQSKKYKLTEAPKRDTVNIPRRGYAVLRWKADNPGVWAFHCHVLVHMVSGMAMAFVDMPENIPDLGISAKICKPKL